MITVGCVRSLDGVQISIEVSGNSSEPADTHFGIGSDPKNYPPPLP